MKTTTAHEHHEDVSKPILGFWVYLMTDLLLFASLFATYAVLRNNTAGGPSGSEIFDMPFVLTETMLLLTSSFTAGLSVLALKSKRKKQVLFWIAVTFLFGAGFLGMELFEFNHLVNEGYSWQRSGFLSAFFTLVGTHGAHITSGLIWVSVLAVQIIKHGLNNHVAKRLELFAMFWHFLDIVWIFIFTFVYLLGVA